MEDTRQIKKAMRKEIKVKRSQLDDDYFRNANEKINQKISRMPSFQNAKCIMFFKSLPDEFQTGYLMDLARQAGKTIVLPRVKDKERMDLHIYTGEEDLVVSPIMGGLEEPAEDWPTVELNDIDLIFVPCMTADADCYRLGHGGGYNDRLLAVYQNESIVPIVDRLTVNKIPREAHDMPVTYVVTEENTYSSKPYSR